MTKQGQFLWIVQTALLVNAVDQTVDRGPGEDRSDVSMTGNWGAITEALRASERIPPDLPAEDAAHEYCNYMFENQREAQENAAGRRMQVPTWLARP